MDYHRETNATFSYSSLSFFLILHMILEIEIFFVSAKTYLIDYLFFW